jgi:hypothetical protein
MRLDPRDEATFRHIIHRLSEHVQAAQDAPDTRAARQALNECWWAIHDAQDRLNRAERAAYDAAFAKLESAA